MKINHTYSQSFFQKILDWFSKLFIRFGRSTHALEAIFKRIRLDHSFTQDQLKQIAKCLTVSYFEKGDSIFHEGDIGDCFYFIKTGSVTIYFTKDDADVVLARLGPGDFFGEQALLEENPGRRMSSAKASEDSELLTLSHIDYIKILNPQIKDILKKIGDNQLFEMFCKTQELLGSIKESALKEFSALVLEYKDGEMVFRAGDEPDRAYFVLSGTVVIEFVDPKGIRKVEIGKGALFGELGVLNGTKRSGTAYAKGAVKLLGYEAKDFRKLYEISPALQQYITSMKSVYEIKHSNTVSLYFGKFLDVNSVIAVYNLEDGSTISAAKAVGNLFFTMKHSDAKDINVISFSSGDVMKRNLGIKDHIIMSVSSYGNWEELREICRLILNREPITDANIQSFIHSGNLGLSKLRIFGESGDQKEILCPCMNISKDEVCTFIAKGINNIEAIIKKTGAGSVCGVCRPKIVELFGMRAWTTVKLVKKISLRANVCSFQFELVEAKKIEYKPGQYIVLSAMIDGKFINRTYTLTSVPDLNPYIEVTVKKEDKGYFSPWLFDKAQEDSLFRISDPAGDFTLPVSALTEIVCFVEGIGVTTALSFARYVAWKNTRKLHIDYSEQAKNDFIFVDELNKIAQENKNISIAFRAVEEVKRIQLQEIQKIVSAHPDADFYVCASDSFEEYIFTHLAELGVPTTRIKVEKFISAGGSIG